MFYNQGPKVWESIHLLQLLILNEYAARYAIAARHYLGLTLVNLISRLYLTADSV